MATTSSVQNLAKDNVFSFESFTDRHVGSGKKDIDKMLGALNFSDLDKFIDSVVPSNIRLNKNLELPLPTSEFQALIELRKIALQNKVYRNYIGLGYSESITPPVILRNILENPGWYTAYTPYQAEIAQGRLEALLNYQTMIMDLTGMEISNASLLDEATAAAEAVTMLVHSKSDENGEHIFIADTCYPQTIDVVETRANPIDLTVVNGNWQTFVPDSRYFCAIVQYPDKNGSILEYKEFVEKCHSKNIKVIVAADLLSLVLLTPPGEWGADAVVGTNQRFGLPLGYGGPHAGYLATRDEFKRQMPGRLIGISKDREGNPALRLSLQTREQHIRRDKATSNICTAQVLLAVISSFYAAYHGPEGLRKIAKRIHATTNLIAAGIKKLGHNIENRHYFDTLKIKLAGIDSNRIQIISREFKMNFLVIDSFTIGISIGETTTIKDAEDILTVINGGKKLPFKLSDLEFSENTIPEFVIRKSDFLTHPVFNSYHTETEILRYMHRLEAKDLSLNAAMIPLGSCTMKLNATVEMIPITWSEFANIHPFAPKDQAQGYARIFQDLEFWLSEITGFAGISLQPNAGSQGEYAGLLTIRGYDKNRGQSNRNICLIPVSAHGTNPASAVMAGYKVVPVSCDANGNIDVSDLKAKAEQHSKNLGALMITYPSTHGVFESTVKEICDIIHSHDANVYMDGANMNAQVGLCRPADIGADVCHLNLHKTFSIPHGGGGPGVGPIGVKKHLLPYLPGHAVCDNGTKNTTGAITASPYGSANILLISYTYIHILGQVGLTHATKLAILNANYIAKRLETYYPVLYKGTSGLVAHECILDFRKFKASANVEVEDVAKRLMDYGFHAPTMSWPVHGTLMIEPTESESLYELDRFCEAMILIHGEISDIENGKLDKENNPLKNSPHTAEMVTRENWNNGYSRERAAFPTKFSKQHKYWPTTARIDNVYGDRNLICSCQPMEEYEKKV